MALAQSRADANREQSTCGNARVARYNYRMTSMRIARSLSACVLLLALAATAAEPASPEKTGLAVGQRAPDFTLKDQNDRDISLSALLKKGPVALVFFRSADW
jgi:cytochrome oxidase Cu insertion factor (SCO1/SenC/PrrC family)